MKGQRGQSLVQVLVIVGVLGTLMAAMASMMAHQHRENRALGEKLAANDLKRVVSTVLAASGCSLLFADSSNIEAGSSRTFLTSASSVTIGFNYLPASSTTSIVSLTSPLASPLSSSLKIKSTGGIQINIENGSTANLIINFDDASSVRPLKSLSFPISYTTTTAGFNSTITGCTHAPEGFSPPGGAFIAVDQRPAGDESTAAGGFGSIDFWVWWPRILNTVRYNSIAGASRHGNRIRLPAGTYSIRASAPAFNTGAHQTKLYNVTDGTDVLIGSSEYSRNNHQIVTRSRIFGTFTIAGTKDFEIRHIYYARTGLNTLGVRVGGGGAGGHGGDVPGITNEVYTVVEIRKEQ
jgi:hypothetical protein